MGTTFVALDDHWWRCPDGWWERHVSRIEFDGTEADVNWHGIYNGNGNDEGDTFNGWVMDPSDVLPDGFEQSEDIGDRWHAAIEARRAEA